MRNDFARLMRRGSGGYEDVHVRRTIIDDDGVRVRARDTRKGWANHRSWNASLVRRFLAARVGKSRATIESEIADAIRTRPERRAFDRIMSGMMVDPDYQSSYRCFSFDAQDRLVSTTPKKQPNYNLTFAVGRINPERIDLGNACAVVLTAGGWVREKIDEMGATKRSPLRKSQWIALGLDRYHFNALLMKEKNAAGANIEAYVTIHNEILAGLVPGLEKMGYRLADFVR